MSNDKNLIREIITDDYKPKRHNFDIQNELHEKIRNEDDYDDWEYGTEPLPLAEWKTNK
jgi:hypothetical protein